MSGKREERLYYDSRCYGCQNDCKSIDPVYKCPHFKQGYTISQYKAMIREDNINLKKLCDKHGLCYNTMMKMLSGKWNITFKYRKCLDEALFEKEEYCHFMEKEEEIPDVK